MPGRSSSLEDEGDGAVLNLGAGVEPYWRARNKTGKTTVNNPARVHGSRRCAPGNRAASPSMDTFSRNALLSPP